MKNKPVISTDNYETLYRKWEAHKNPWPVVIGLLTISAALFTGSLLTSDVFIVTFLLCFLALGALYISFTVLNQRYVKGYCLDASFTLAPIDPAFPNGFKRITASQFQVFPDGDNPLTPPSGDIRLRIPLAGLTSTATCLKNGKPDYTFSARCTSLTPLSVFVTISESGNRVILTLHDLVALVARHDYTIDWVVNSAGHLIATSLTKVEKHEIRHRAEEVLEMFQKTKQIAKCSLAPEIIGNLKKVIHLTHAENFTDWPQRKAGPGPAKKAM